MTKLKKVPQLKKKRHDWEDEPEDGLLAALFWDRIMDPGDMSNLAFAGDDVQMYFDDFIIVPTSKTDPDDVDDLRVLDLYFGYGVTALWSDELQSIMAFAFSKSTFTEEEARAWLKESKNLTASSFQPDAEALALMSFEEIRGLVQVAINKHFGVKEDDGDRAVPFGAYPWIVELSDDMAIVDWEDKNYIVLYDLEDDVVKVRDASEIKKLWKRTDNDEIISMDANGDGVVYAFTSALQDGTVADVDDDDLIWKEILHAGRWFKTNSGKEIRVTDDIIDEAFAAFEAGMPKYIQVPANHHHIRTSGVVPAEDNRGFVRKLKKIDGALYAGFDLTNAETRAGVDNGSIADCSVYLQPGLFHNNTGHSFKWVLRHVLLTNDPLVNDLSEFGEIPASGGDAVLYFTMGGVKMGKEFSLSDEQVAKLEALDLGADDLIALAGQRDAIQAHAAQLLKQTRDLEIGSIVAAMEGNGEHDGVVVIDGYRHYPVVASAIEKALKDLPEAIALDASDDGKTPIDAVLLAIANAIPAEGRMALDASTPKQPKNSAGKEGKKINPADLSDEDFEEYMRQQTGE